MERGYFKIYRKIEDSKSWSRGALYRGLMITLLEKANWKRGFFHGQEVLPGQIAFSGEALAEELDIPRTSVVRMLRNLEVDGFLTRSNMNNRYTLITIINWHRYQNVENEVGQPTVDQWLTNGRPADTIKEGKKERIKTDAKASLSTPSVDTEAEPDETQVETQQAKQRSSASSACPYEKIVALYHKALPEHQAVKVMNKTRKGHIKARWVEVGSRLASMNRQNDEASRLEWLGRFFKRAANSDFLTGKVSRRDNGRPFFADLDFLFSPNGFAGVIEGKYENREVA